jgi:uncharacterized protein
MLGASMRLIGRDRLVRHHPEYRNRDGFRRASRSAVVVAVELLAALLLVFTTSQASAQFFFDNRSSNERARSGRPVQQQSQWFWPWQQWQQPQQAVPRRIPRPPSPPVDFSKAPPPRKQDTQATGTQATTRVVIMGDSMADWLAYGLEDVLSERPEIRVIRKVHSLSGLLPSESRDAYDWPVQAREILAAENPDLVVMMIGLADRRTARERQINSAGRQRIPQESQQTPQPGHTPAPGEQAAGAAHDDKTASDTMSYEFRSEKWSEFYGKRIDDMIVALKSKGVPVAWVGLPAIRGTKATADVAYLDDLYRRHAEKAGIIYIDLWDGFVDESGNFAPNGPDVEGQIRRLRTSDGVYFTKAGAHKLGHYVERELARLTSARATPVEMPPAESAQTPASAEPPQVPARPLAGPVVPLTAVHPDSGELLGDAPSKPSSPSPLATRVLVKGEPIAAPMGRADDFVWPRREGLPGPEAGVALLDPPSPTLPPIASSKDSAAAGPAGPIAPKPRVKHARKRTAPRLVDRTPWQFGANVLGFQPFGFSQEVSAARPWMRRSQP